MQNYPVDSSVIWKPDPHFSKLPLLYLSRVDSPFIGKTVTVENYREHSCEFCGGAATPPNKPVCLACMFESTGAPVPRWALAVRALVGQLSGSTTQLYRFHQEHSADIERSMLSREWLDVYEWCPGGDPKNYEPTNNILHVSKDHIIKVREYARNEIQNLDPEAVRHLKLWKKANERTSKNTRQRNIHTRLDRLRTEISEAYGQSCVYCNEKLGDAPLLDVVIQTGMRHNIHGRMEHFFRAMHLIGNVVPVCRHCNYLKAISESIAGQTLRQIRRGRYQVAAGRQTGRFLNPQTGLPRLGNSYLPPYLHENCTSERDRYALGRNLKLYACAVSKFMLRITQRCHCGNTNLWMRYDDELRQIEIGCDKCLSPVPRPHVLIERPRTRIPKQNRRKWGAE